MRETHRLLVMPAERRGSTTDRTEGEALIEKSIFILETLTLEQSENFSAWGEDNPLVEDEMSLKVPSPAQNERRRFSVASPRSCYSRGMEYLTLNIGTMYIITLLILIFVIIFFYVYMFFQFL